MCVCQKGSDESKARPMLARIPMGEFLEIEHVVSSALYLLSPLSERVNGVELPLDGGFLAAPFRVDQQGNLTEEMPKQAQETDN